MDDFRNPPRRKFGLLNFGYAQQSGMDEPSQYDAFGRQLGTRPRLMTPVAWRPDDQKWGPVGLGEGRKVFERKLGLAILPRVQRNFDSVVGTITGSAFDRKAMSQIKSELLANLSEDDLKLFETTPSTKNGIVSLNPQQWGAVTRMIAGFPEDELGQRVRGAFDHAVRSGRLRQAGGERRRQ